MPSRHRPRRPGRRPTAALHPTRPRPGRPAPRPQRSRRPTAPKAAGLPRKFRDTPTAANVLEQCTLPGCTSAPVFKNKGTRYCCPGHRLKHWRMKQRAAKDAATRTAANDPPHLAAPSRRRRGAGGVGRRASAGAGLGAGARPPGGTARLRPPRRGRPGPASAAASGRGRRGQSRAQAARFHPDLTSSPSAPPHAALWAAQCAGYGQLERSP